MKPPKCPVCHGHHHLRDPHLFAEPSQRQRVTDAEPTPMRQVIRTGNLANTPHVANSMANSIIRDVANADSMANEHTGPRPQSSQPDLPLPQPRQTPRLPA